jgi:hypothetical protein
LQFSVRPHSSPEPAPSLHSIRRRLTNSGGRPSWKCRWGSGADIALEIRDACGTPDSGNCLNTRKWARHPVFSLVCRSSLVTRCRRSRQRWNRTSHPWSTPAFPHRHEWRPIRRMSLTPGDARGNIAQAAPRHPSHPRGARTPRRTWRMSCRPLPIASCGAMERNS